jgi:hypothetical protein
MIQVTSVRSTTTEQGAILLNTADGTLYTLNGTAAAIWCLLAQHRSQEYIRDAISKQHPAITRDELCDDLDALLTRLVSLGLITT